MVNETTQQKKMLAWNAGPFINLKSHAGEP